MSISTGRVQKLIAEGQRAMEQTNWADARKCYKQALQFKEAPEILECLGNAAWWLDDAKATFESREKAFQLYRSQGNARAAARVAISIAYDYFSFRGEYALSNGWSRRAHRLLRNLETVPEHGWLKAWDGNVAIEADHDPAKALRLGNEAANIAQQVQDFDLQMISSALQGLALVFEGKVDEGMPLLDEAATAAMAGEISDLETGINVCCYLIAACEYVRDYSRAVQWCFHVKKNTGNGTFPLMFSFCQIHYAGVLTWNGDWDEAETLLKKASNNLIESRPAHAAEGLVKLGAIDPLEEIAGICEDHDLWLHADGACGAVGAMLPEKKHLYKGLEMADSVTLDPHKWLYIPYECGCVLVKNSEKLRRSFSMTASYLRGTLPTEYTGLDYFEHGPQMSRDFKALKVWMTLKTYGAEGYRKLLTQNIRCAEYLDKLVRESVDFQAYHKPELFIYSFRYAPETYRAALQNESEKAEEINEYLDKLNQLITDEIQLSGTAFLMTTKLYGRTVLRLSICSHRTTLSDIEVVFNKLRELGRRLEFEITMEMRS